jgi:hypothetical protein
LEEIFLAIYTISYKDISEVTRNLRDISYEHWLLYELFTFHWWFLLALSIIPWIIWWKVLDKYRMNEIIMFGLFIGLFSVIFEYIGEYIALWWGYKIKLFPGGVTHIFPFDLTVLPVSYMLAYQYFPKWRSFFLGMLTLSFGAAFVFEPLLDWMDIYVLITWKYFYSFPIYLLMGLFFKWLVKKIK